MSSLPEKASPPVDLQPLRIPAGWRIDWNTLCEIDPGEESVRRGFFGGSSLFSAVHEQRRFWLDVEWSPEDEPDGCYRLRLEYAPWPRTEAGRRRKDEALHFRDGEVVHTAETSLREELVRELEATLRRCVDWVIEAS